MANSSKKIIRGVRVGNKTYTTGMEDELSKVLPSEASKRLTEKGYIEGSWRSVLEVAPAEPTEDLSSLTVAELRDRARDAEIEGFSTMNKADLVDALGRTKET